ncbi:thioredoxin-dependent thiol peroxidase [Pseudochrobactrum sp. XF203]|uniref:thioredoxin-dependent thiol peroxidase n=1 Tax=Pseudochrobactrum sp. XF203 TaxID=2879116 RepID=UPI001CE24E31|nr:thioredoxin-dependent thiol peroxidase [Pseudochrobactrum sp. XF203]UCA44464.1 thioredoxin-dependent thiol peroxidase [Pseudochrobactrum sp. XF203]
MTNPTDNVAAIALQAGDPAPAFSLPKNGDDTLSSASLQGKAYVLYFYPKDDTSGCTREAIDFSALKPEFNAINVSIIGVSPDSVRKHDKFIDKHDLTIELLADEEKSLSNAYGVWVEKSMYGRKYMGIERSTFLIGKDGKIAQVWRKVKVAGHAEAVLEAARKLG